ncbi:hypothetical protein L484_003101 [Morus notabilis]|uniref:Uncharacterized protein n=1 Tax=Morus notabilis TaxID=981085 RepID=W9QZW9_9ROSA|nr:hypothetical protein L484_003101 [Morus notabilis]
MKSPENAIRGARRRKLRRSNERITPPDLSLGDDVVAGKSHWRSSKEKRRGSGAIEGE